MFIAFRFSVDSTADCPPERKLIVGTAAGTARRNTVSVASATSSGAALRPLSEPGRTMFGLSTMPSSSTPCVSSAANTAFSTASVTSAQRAIVCPPSISTSGSTMGTTPASWQMRA